MKTSNNGPSPERTMRNDAARSSAQASGPVGLRVSGRQRSNHRVEEDRLK